MIVAKCPACGKVLGESNGKELLSVRGGMRFWLPFSFPAECRCGQKVIVHPTGAVVRYNTDETKAVAPISTPLMGV